MEREREREMALVRFDCSSVLTAPSPTVAGFVSYFTLYCNSVEEQQ